MLSTSCVWGKLVLFRGMVREECFLQGSSLARVYEASWESLSCLSHQLLEEDDSWNVPGFHGFCGGCNCAGGNWCELLSDSSVAFPGRSSWLFRSLLSPRLRWLGEARVFADKLGSGAMDSVPQGQNSPFLTVCTAASYPWKGHSQK